MNPRTVPYHKLSKRIRESMRNEFYLSMRKKNDVKSPAQQFDESHKKWVEGGRE